MNAKRRQLTNRIKASKQELLENPLGNFCLLISDWIKKQKINSQKDFPVESHQKSHQKIRNNSEYSSDALQGIQVSHDLNEFQVGKDHILVLKDSDILKEEEDVLICSSIKNEKLDIGKYTGYDDQEFKNLGCKINILSQYDDDKIVTKGFRILSENIPQKQVEEGLGGISCVVEKKIVQDHDTTFKKIKKRSKSRKKELESFPKLDLMELGSTSNKKKIIGDFVDDDDLQISIAKVRKAKMGAEFVANGNRVNLSNSDF